MPAVPPYSHVKYLFQHLYKLQRAVDVRIGSLLYNVVYIFEHPIKENEFKRTNLFLSSLNYILSCWQSIA